MNQWNTLTSPTLRHLYNNNINDLKIYGLVRYYTLIIQHKNLK